MRMTRTLLACAAMGLTLSGVMAQEPPTPAEDAPAVPVAPAPATASATLTLSLESTGDIERTVVTYQCKDETSLTVQYINAAPNFLAILPVDGENHVFVTTISASGARYVAGPYEWWNKGGDGTLRDLMQDEGAAPMAECTETSNTP